MVLVLDVDAFSISTFYKYISHKNHSILFWCYIYIAFVLHFLKMSVYFKKDSRIYIKNAVLSKTLCVFLHLVGKCYTLNEYLILIWLEFFLKKLRNMQSFLGQGLDLAFECLHKKRANKKQHWNRRREKD